MAYTELAFPCTSKKEGKRKKNRITQHKNRNWSVKEFMRYFVNFSSQVFFFPATWWRSRPMTNRKQQQKGKFAHYNTLLQQNRTEPRGWERSVSPERKNLVPSVMEVSWNMVSSAWWMWEKVGRSPGLHNQHCFISSYTRTGHPWGQSILLTEKEVVITEYKGWKGDALGGHVWFFFSFTVQMKSQTTYRHTPEHPLWVPIPPMKALLDMPTRVLNCSWVLCLIQVMALTRTGSRVMLWLALTQQIPPNSWQLSRR